MKKTLLSNFTDQEFKNMAENSESISQLMLKLGYASSESVGSRKAVIERCLDLDIKPPFATGKVMARNAIKARTKSIEEYFQDNVSRTGHTTRDKIIRENLLEYKCAICGNKGIWRGKAITLEIDHINGKHLDNRLSNLRFLCPNCHAQTQNFRGKNIHKEKQINKCKNCGIQINKGSILCVKCAGKARRLPNRPSLEQLQKDIEKSNYSQTAKKYNVSFTCIKKWIKEYQANN